MNRNKYIKSLALFSCIALFLGQPNISNLSAQAESNGANSDTSGPRGGKSEGSSRQFRSFLDYAPRAVQFDAALSTVARFVEQGAEFVRNRNIPRAETAFRNALAAGDSLEHTLNRASLDQLFFLEGYAFEGLAKTKEALKAYAGALKSRPSNTLALFRHAMLLKASGKCSDAIPEFREIMWQAPTFDYELLYLTGECYDQLGQNEDATKAYQTAYSKNPGFLPVLKVLTKMKSTELAQTLDPKKRLTLQTQLLSQLNSLSKADPNDKENTRELIKLLMSTGDRLVRSPDLDRAIALAEKLAEESAYRDDNAVQLLIQAQMKRDKIPEAGASLQRGLQANPKSKLLLGAAQQLELQKSVKEQAEKAPEE